MTPWRSIKRWCMGGNDEFPTCFWAMFANDYLLTTGIAMPTVEIMNAAREMVGLNPYDRSTDHGEYLDAGFRYIMGHGWPGDPLLKPDDWHKINVDKIDATIIDLGAVCAWCMLPMIVGDDGEDEPDFSDYSLHNGITGTAPHALLLVETQPNEMTAITWARPQSFSRAWWDAYGRDCYAVRYPVAA